MRSTWLTLAGLLVLVPALPAQQAAPPAPSPDRLNVLLQKWEEKMQSVQTLEAQCTRMTLDKTYQSTDVFEGTAKYMKPNLALLDMKKKGRPEVYERYLCTGTFLYEYAPQNRIIRIHELPPPKPGQVAEDNFLSFLFGMRAAEARRRYDIKLVKEDQWYIYLEILPREQTDKSDFEKARLVLLNNTFLPRQLWFMQPNGNEITWDIPKIDSGAGARVARSDFAPPKDPPPGWTFQRVPRQDARRDVPPRIVRPQQ
jgi:TIGR03009 family protein